MKQKKENIPDNKPQLGYPTSRREFIKMMAAVASTPLVASFPADFVLAASSDVTSASSGIPMRPLGKTGVKIPILGFGGDGLVSDSTDKEAVEKFLIQVLDSGITFFDTAHLYGENGLAEKNIGLITGTPRRKEIFLATKTGSRTHDGAMRQVEESLRRLKVDYLDLIQVHHLHAGDKVRNLGGKEGALTAMLKLKEQKVVRFIGITGHPDAPQVKEALEIYDWDTFMCFVNPARFSKVSLEEHLPLAVKKNIGIIAMKTFGGRPGLLVGDGPGKADARSLLRFAWTQPITVAIPGVRNSEQLMDNLAVARSFQPMTPAEMQSLTGHINNVQRGWREG